MDDVKAWLNSNHDYNAGASIYLKYGKDKLLHKMFSEPPSDFKRKRLHQALLSIYNSQKQTTRDVAETKEAVITRTVSADHQWPDDPDEVLAALKAKWKPLFAEMMHLSTVIYDVALKGEKDEASKQEAGRIAHRILELDDCCDAIYEQRDYYLKEKRLPAEHQEPDDLVVDPKKIPLALQNAQRYAREYKTKIAKEPANEKAAAKLKHWQGRMAHYKKELNITE
jgi:hypothetical protein